MFDPRIVGAPRPETVVIQVVAGSVACRRLGSVPVERCLECPYLLRIESEGRTVVRCITSTAHDLA